MYFMVKGHFTSSYCLSHALLQDLNVSFLCGALVIFELLQGMTSVIFELLFSWKALYVIYIWVFHLQGFPPKGYYLPAGRVKACFHAGPLRVL